MFKTEILLVDDAKIFIDIQKDFLKYSPVHIVTAYNGTEALETVRRKRPDLIVMDVGMPEPDGVSCCEIIKEERALGDIPVILISTNSGHEDIASYRKAGCSAILHKPLQRREYLNKLFQFVPVIERREPRISCRMPVSVETETGTFAGIAHDIAMNGIYVETNRDMNSTNEIILNFRIPPGNDKAIVARGRVAWRNGAGENTDRGLPKGFGAEFLDITGEDGTIIGYNHLVAFLMKHKAF